MNLELLKTILYILGALIVGYAYYEYGWKRDKRKREQNRKLKSDLKKKDKTIESEEKENIE